MTSNTTFVEKMKFCQVPMCWIAIGLQYDFHLSEKMVRGFNAVAVLFHRKLGGRVLFFMSLRKLLIIVVTELLAPYALWSSSIARPAVCPRRMSLSIKSQTFFLREYLHLHAPRSSLVKSFAGFLPPMPSRYSCHSSCKVLGEGCRVALLLVFATCSCTGSPRLRLVCAFVFRNMLTGFRSILCVTRLRDKP